MKKRFTPSDLKHFTYLSWPVMSEDGQKIACVSRKAEEENGSFPPSVHLYEKQADGGYQENRSQYLEDAEAPYFLRDGRHMIYLSGESGEKQVWIRNLASGEKRRITSLRHGVSYYRLSPDEQLITFAATLWPEEAEEGTACTEMTPQEKALWEAELEYTPYAAETLTYKMDEWYGMRKGEFSHIGIASLDGQLQQIFDVQGYEAEVPVFSHSGEQIAFYAYCNPGAYGRQKELFVIRRDGSGLRQVTEKCYLSELDAPIWTADDSRIVLFQYKSFADASYVLMPFCVDLEDGRMIQQFRDDDETICSGSGLFIAGRTENGRHSANAYLSADGQELYFLSGFRGHTAIYRVRLRGKDQPNPIELVQAGSTDIQGFYRTLSGRLVYLQGTFSRPADLFCQGFQLTDCNSWLEAYEMPQVEEVCVPTKDGKELLHYYLWHPVGQIEGELYPAVLDIKGGPETMYTACYWHEFHALTSAGMAVIAPNPRGSAGFGRSYLAGGICWKQEVVDDMETFVQDAVKKGFIDPARVGVTGGSYGGYMTNKLMGRSELFAAAVSQRSLVNPGTSYGTGDQGFISSQPVPEDFKMLDYLEDRIKGNIITYIDHFKIPLLILHAKKDYRCTFEQAEQLFIAMKDRNPEVPVRLVMFPEENHNLTRGGKLHSQIRHLQELTDWFAKYLDIQNPERKGEQINGKTITGI